MGETLLRIDVGDSRENAAEIYIKPDSGEDPDITLSEEQTELLIDSALSNLVEEPVAAD